VCVCVCVVLGMGSGPSHVPGKCSTAELHPQSQDRVPVLPRIGDKTQGLMLLPGSASDCDPPPSASQVAGITGPEECFDGWFTLHCEFVHHPFCHAQFFSSRFLSQPLSWQVWILPSLLP
jgi:hypothetical protein